MLALLATLLGRAVAPALPGTVAGIDGLIEASRLVAGVVSVNLFFLAGMLTVWLGIASLAHSDLPASYRLGVLPATATVVVLGTAALLAPIESRWLLWMGVISASVALVAVPSTLADSRSRAAGFVLLLVGIVAFVQLLARMLAVRASDGALAVLFGYARAFSTLGFVVHIAALALVGAWLAARRWTLLAGVGTGALAVSAFVAWGAAGGTHIDASLLQVLAARAFDELTRHPVPYVSAGVRHTVDVLTLITVALVVGARRRSALLAAAMGLALLGSGNADIPLCALMLTLGALLGPLAPMLDGLSAPRRSSLVPSVPPPPDDLLAESSPSARAESPKAPVAESSVAESSEPTLTLETEPDSNPVNEPR